MTDQTPAIPPYWTRLGGFFRYPLALEPLLACCGFGLLAGLATMLFAPANIVLEIVLLVATLRYGYKVLERTGSGHLDDSLAFVDSAHGGKYRPYKQFVVIAVALSICAYTASVAGSHLALVLLVLFALLLPANTMPLAVTNDLGESMSPPRLWALINGIGMPYLGLCACLLLLSFSSGGLLGLLQPLVPEALLGVVAGFVGGYFTIVMFRLMGYALYQYHGVLGLAVDVGFERQAAAIAPPDPARQRAAQSAQLLKEGRYDEAIALARVEVNVQPGDLAANLRLVASPDASRPRASGDRGAGGDLAAASRFPADGWLALVTIVPLIGALMALALLFIGGEEEDNEYGPMRLSAGAGRAIVVVVAFIAASGLTYRGMQESPEKALRFAEAMSLGQGQAALADEPGAELSLGEPVRYASNNRIAIYVVAGCSDCEAMRAWLETNGLRPIVDSDERAAERLHSILGTTGRIQLPVLEVNGKVLSANPDVGEVHGHLCQASS